MHEPSFNLIDQPWIPCIDQAGETVTLSLRQVLTQAHDLKAIAGDSPPVTVALHRLLLAVLHRVFGPENEDAWVELWEADSFSAAQIERYLTENQPHFDLFGERPFYQSPDKRMKAKSIINLSHDRASGNNPTFFDHHTEEEGESLPPALAARLLITAHAYGLAGLSGIKNQNFTDGTCAGGIVFLVEGETLKQTFLLNMIQYPPNTLFEPQTERDAPAWEMDDPYTHRTFPFGYLDYLTWQNRRILLHPEWVDGVLTVRSITMGPALRMDAAVLDPMKHYRKDDKLGHLALSFTEDRVLWRDSATLFEVGRETSGKMRPPATLDWLNMIIHEMDVPDKHTIYRTLALGMSKKQAKVFFFRQEQFPLPLDYLTNHSLVIALNEALQQAGTISFDLLQSVRLMGMIEQLPTVEERELAETMAGAKF